jgi:hypothetical protein
MSGLRSSTYSSSFLRETSLASRCFVPRCTDDELRGLASNLTPRNAVHFSDAQAEAHREIEEEVPLRLESKHALEQLVSLLLGVPVHVWLRHRLHRDVRHVLELAALPQESEYRPNENEMLVDRFRSEMLPKLRLQAIER